MKLIHSPSYSLPLYFFPQITDTAAIKAAQSFFSVLLVGYDGHIGRN